MVESLSHAHQKKTPSDDNLCDTKLRKVMIDDHLFRAATKI